MKKLTLLFSFVVCVLFTNAQTPNWLWGETETTDACYTDNNHGLYVGSVSGDVYMNGRFNGTLTLGGAHATSTASWSEVVSGRMNPTTGSFSWLAPHPMTNGTDYAYGFGIDANENTYSTGQTQGSDGYFLDKYSSAGTIDWSYTLASIGGVNDAGYGKIAVDNSGNVYATGLFNGTKNFGAFSLTAVGGDDMFLIKHNGATGAPIWGIHAGATGQTDAGRGVVFDPAGNVYVCGAYNGTTKFYNAGGTLASTLPAVASSGLYIVKYDLNGNFIWVQTASNAGFQGGGANFWQFWDLTVDACSNVYVTGHFTGTAAFGSTNLVSAGGLDIYVAKCHSNGTWEWAKRAGGSNNDEGLGITLDKNNDIYITGYFVSSANFSGTTVTSTAGNDIFIAKYANSTGDLQWVQAGGGSLSTSGEAIGVDSKGFAYATGGIASAASGAIFGPSNIGGVTTCGQNILMVKLDTVPQRAIVPTISASYCAGQTATIPYSLLGTFNAGNTFTAQLSDANGSFASPTSIGNVSSQTAGSISVTIPSVAPGSNYLIRVVSTSPATSSYATCNYITISGTTISVNLTPANPAVCNGSSVTLKASGGTNYTWTGSASTADSLVVSPSANATYTVNGVTGTCTGSATVTVTVNSTPTVTITGNTAVCPGASSILTGNGATTYVWSDASTNTTFTAAPASSGIKYYVTGTTGTCSAADTVTMTINPSPTVTITGGLAVCPGGSSILTGNGGTTYVWGDGFANNTFTATPPSTGTKYYVTGKNSITGCTAADTVTMTVNPSPTITASASTAICPGNTVPLEASGAGTGGNYTWSPATGLSTTSGPVTNSTPTLTTTYTVVGTDVNTCTGNTVVTVTVDPNPTVTVTPNVAVCAGSTASLTSSGGTDYTWAPAIGLSSSTVADPTASPVSTTIYTVTVSNGSCTAKDSTTVTINPLPVIVASGTATILAGNGATLGVTNATSGDTYSWSPATSLSCNTCADPVATPTVNTWYNVTATNSSGCTEQDSVLITVKQLCGPVYMPNAFSPNGDGNNDVLKVYGNCIQSMALTIFDRWGNVVYQSTNPDAAWDGTSKGQNLNTGTYIYTLVVTDEDNNTTNKKGNITLLK